MYEEQLKTMTLEEKKSFLSDNCAKIEQSNYLRKYTDDELAAKKDEFAKESISLADKEDEFSEIKKDWTSVIKDLKSGQKQRLKNIRQKGEYKTGNVYLLDDQEEGFMYSFSEDGDLIEKRRLRPDEKQTSIKGIRRAS